LKLCLIPTNLEDPGHPKKMKPWFFWEKNWELPSGHKLRKEWSRNLSSEEELKSNVETG